MTRGASQTGVLASLLRLNTRLFRECLRAVEPARAERRPGEAGNSMAFIALHVVDSRFYLARQLGRELENPFGAYADVTSEVEVERLPSLPELLEAWERVSPVAVDAVESLDADRARAPAPTRFPVDDPSLLGMAAFLVQHESYHLGQLALLRRHHGLPPIPWS